MLSMVDQPYETPRAAPEHEPPQASDPNADPTKQRFLWFGVLTLGFGGGLPLLLVVGDVLKVWLRESGLDPGTIGLFGLAALPYTIKVLWAPVIDKLVPPLGRRRGWLLLSQVIILACCLALMLLAQIWAAPPLTFVALLTLLVGIASATQDVAGDAWRCDSLSEAQRGPGASLWVLAYRCGMLIAGGVSLWVADGFGWSAAFALLAACMVIPMLGTLAIKEPEIQPPTSWQSAIVSPLQEFIQRLGGKLVLVALFIIGFGLGDAVLNAQAAVFLVDAGYDKTDIGAIKTGLGLVAVILGTLLGGFLLPWLGLKKGLIIFGFLQAASNGAYAWLAWVAPETGPDVGLLSLVVAAENFAGGLAKAPFIAWMMGTTDPRYSATQYALLTACLSFGRDLIVAPLGFAVAGVGWAWFFAASGLIAIPALLLVPFIHQTRQATAAAQATTEKIGN